MKLRQNEAYWSDKDERWHIYVQTQGVRRHFVSEKGLTSRKGKLQAERKADKWLEEQLSDENQKVEVLYDKWIADLRARTGTAHTKKCESIGRVWIKPAIGNKRMSAINENDFDRIIAAAYRKGLAKKSLQNIRSTINAFLKYSRKARVTSLVADDIIVPKNAPVKPKRILSKPEISKVFSSDQTSRYNKPIRDFYVNFYRFQIFEGLRPGEVLGLRWKDLTDNGYEINQAINTDNETTTGKNENAHRRHAFSSFSRRLIEDQKALLRELGIFSQYVFPGPDGKAAVEHTVYKAWRKFCDYNGIGAISLYELRHTNYSINKDMPEAYKKLLFGHSDDFDGDFVYSHEMDGDLEAAAEMNETAFMAILSPKSE